MWSCPVGTNECSTVTGSGDFPECRTVWSDGDVFDMSGNLQEWTNTAQGTGIHEIRGGSYNDVENGRTCDFNFVVGSTTFRFPNTGFRCCWYPPASGETCTTYAATGLPVTGPEMGDLNHTITVPSTPQAITHVRLLDVTGTDPNRFGDLEFRLISPSGTTLFLINNRCGSDTNWAFDLTESASLPVTDGTFCTGSGPAGISVNNAWQPENALSTFTGQNATGTWTLRITDTNDRGGTSTDKATLTAWNLQICTPTYTIP
jgi:subtilisin-like proprotein convertase family protein